MVDVGEMASPDFRKPDACLGVTSGVITSGGLGRKTRLTALPPVLLDSGVSQIDCWAEAAIWVSLDRIARVMGWEGGVMISVAVGVVSLIKLDAWVRLALLLGFSKPSDRPTSSS